MAILVTGGAGYIGSHMVHTLLERGEAVVVIDDLSTGMRDLIPSSIPFIKGDIADAALVSHALRDWSVNAVIHFAGSIVVPESVSAPLRYYKNNTAASHSLIQACVANGVRNFIFSSTAAVYGLPENPLVDEIIIPDPINPYGRSKFMTEWILEDTARAHDFRFMALRYFNVAGADPEGRTGQSNPNSSHLIKRACLAALGRVPYLTIFGTDYSTPDGTGIRDYIHITDLVAAHILALEALRKGHTSGIYNCGYGTGFSVREVIAVAERISGNKIRTKEEPRRSGDVAILIADSSKLRHELGWHPAHQSLEKIVLSAYEWEQRRFPVPC